MWFSHITDQALVLQGSPATPRGHQDATWQAELEAAVMWDAGDPSGILLPRHSLLITASDPPPSSLISPSAISQLLLEPSVEFMLLLSL